MFTLMPETHLAVFISDVMAPNESIIIQNTEKFSKSSGYAWDFKWEDEFYDK